MIKYVWFSMACIFVKAEKMESCYRHNQAKKLMHLRGKEPLYESVFTTLQKKAVY